MRYWYASIAPDCTARRPCIGEAQKSVDIVDIVNKRTNGGQFPQGWRHRGEHLEVAVCRSTDDEHSGVRVPILVLFPSFKAVQSNSPRASLSNTTTAKTGKVARFGEISQSVKHHRRFNGIVRRLLYIEQKSTGTNRPELGNRIYLPCMHSDLPQEAPSMIQGTDLALDRFLGRLSTSSPSVASDHSMTRA
jgi:hypothetical protein